MSWPLVVQLVVLVVQVGLVVYVRRLRRQVEQLSMADRLLTHGRLYSQRPGKWS